MNAAQRLRALTEKQKQLDINGDGEIDGEDLKRLRNGEKPVAEKTEASNQQTKETTMTANAASRLKAAETKAPVKAAYKNASDYDWFKYTGKGVKFTTKTGFSAELKKGDVFGVRQPPNRPKVRLVFAKLGPTKVFAINNDAKQYLAKLCTPHKI